jgi:hypothetical protein
VLAVVAMLVDGLGMAVRQHSSRVSVKLVGVCILQTCRTEGAVSCEDGLLQMSQQLGM